MSRFALTAVLLLGLVHSSRAVNCIQCNSADDKQKDCGTANEAGLQKYSKSCPKLTEGTFKNSEAIGCRKILQSIVDDSSAVIRECAYKGEDVDGQKKTGNQGIALYYYQCTNKDNKPCNGASAVFTSLTTLLTAALLLNRYL